MLGISASFLDPKAILLISLFEVPFVFFKIKCEGNIQGWVMATYTFLNHQLIEFLLISD